MYPTPLCRLTYTCSPVHARPLRFSLGGEERPCTPPWYPVGVGINITIVIVVLVLCAPAAAAAAVVVITIVINIIVVLAPAPAAAAAVVTNEAPREICGPLRGPRL